MYESIDVWKRVNDEKLIRYRCFRSLVENKYFVQSVDCYYPSFDADQARFFDKQFLELLNEDCPENRSDSYDSLEEAINKYS